MNAAREQLERELEATQHALAEVEARCARQDAEHRATTKKLEDARKEIEQAYREWMAALDVVETPIFVHGKDFHILGCNQAYQRNAGIPFRQIIGQPYYEIFPKTHAPLPDCARALESSVAEGDEGFLVGDTAYRSRAHSVTDGQGAYLYSVHILEDITKRKRVEEDLRQAHMRLRRFIDSNITGIVIATPTGEIVEANDYYLNLIGFSREELEQGKVDWRTITPPEWLPADEQAIRELRERGTCTPYEKEYVRRDGARVSVFLADAMLPGPEEQIAAFVLDISDRKRAEKEIRMLNAELEQRVAERTVKLEAAYKELEGFAYSVSHDLRTPLRAIDGFSHQVLKRYADKLDDEGKRYLNVVRDNTRKMGQLIDDILAFSRMGRLEISMAEVSMEELVRTILEEIKLDIAGRELAMEVKPLPPCHGDLSMLRQVWVNLLNNSIKFTRPKAAARVEVGGYTQDAENIYYVKDNGVGFDMRYADKLFGVFQRLHGNEEFEGSGIGLAIVKRIVTRHGGRVWADGKVGEGAVFYFALPV